MPSAALCPGLGKDRSPERWTGVEGGGALTSAGDAVPTRGARAATSERRSTWVWISQRRAFRGALPSQRGRCRPCTRPCFSVSRGCRKPAPAALSPGLWPRCSGRCSRRVLSPEPVLLPEPALRALGAALRGAELAVLFCHQERPQRGPAGHAGREAAGYV